MSYYHQDSSIIIMMGDHRSIDRTHHDLLNKTSLQILGMLGRFNGNMPLCHVTQQTNKTDLIKKMKEHESWLDSEACQMHLIYHTWMYEWMYVIPYTGCISIYQVEHGVRDSLGSRRGRGFVGLRGGTIGCSIARVLGWGTGVGGRCIVGGRGAIGRRGPVSMRVAF